MDEKFSFTLVSQSLYVEHGSKSSTIFRSFFLSFFFLFHSFFSSLLCNFSCLFRARKMKTSPACSVSVCFSTFCECLCVLSIFNDFYFATLVARGSWVEERRGLFSNSSSSCFSVSNLWLFRECSQRFISFVVSDENYWIIYEAKIIFKSSW